jgi:hypothetical protein
MALRRTVSSHCETDAKTDGVLILAQSGERAKATLGTLNIVRVDLHESAVAA